MIRFKIEQEIETLATNALLPGEGTHFEANGIKFSHWDFNIRDGWTGKSWVAEDEIGARTYDEATRDFETRLNRVIPRIAFVSQCYIEAAKQPFVVTRPDSQIAVMRFSKSVEATGLMFRKPEREALLKLLIEPIADEFFLYWNDAVNSTGYAAKILLMCAAVETLGRSAEESKEQKFSRIETILGKELKDKLWGIEGKSREGLRHRLAHGEYFAGADASTNYLEELHKGILLYFNNHILGKSPLSLQVVHPQRHPFGVRRGGVGFIRAVDEYPLSLRELVREFDEVEFGKSAKYELVWDKSEQETFLNQKT